MARASPENSAKHVNKGHAGTLPINLYAASPTVQSLDFTVLSEAAAVPGRRKSSQWESFKMLVIGPPWPP